MMLRSTMFRARSCARISTTQSLNQSRLAQSNACSNRLGSASPLPTKRGLTTSTPASTPPQPNLSSTKSTSPNPTPPSAKLRKALAVVFFSGATAFTFYLGTWQYQRYYWKIDLLEERRLRLEDDPMHFTTLAELAEVGDDAVQRVSCRGTYDFSRQMICGPRPAPRGIKTSSAIRATGFNVITPLFLENSPNGEQVLVNRGWVPKDEVVGVKVENIATGNDVASVQTVDAVVAHQENATMLVKSMQGPEKDTDNSKNDNDKNKVSSQLFLWFDQRTMAERAGIDPDNVVLLDVIVSNGNETETKAPFGRPLDSYLEFGVAPETHMGYCATWFGISATGLVVALRFLLRK